MIGGLKAQRILILADACFSGDFLNVNRGASPTIDSAYYRQALKLVARQVLTSGASQSVPDDSEFGRQLVSLLERNTNALLDPVSMFDYIRRGVKQTLPLLGSMPDNMDGASFVLFLRSGGSMASALPSSSFGSSGLADLMVRAEEGAEILVDGVPRGKAPVLVKKVEAGRPLEVMARTDSMAGSAEVTLNPGELREVSIKLSPLSGNLFISASESAVNLWIDGVDKGPLGSGIFKGLAVGVHQLELRGKGLYAKVPATIS
jgi:hypothetical protein